MMGRKSKAHRPPGVLRQLVAENVKALRDLRLRELETETQRNKKLATMIGSSVSQIQRICSGTLGVSIDQIEDLAKALRCAPHDLLTPYYGNTLEHGGKEEARSTASRTFPGSATV
jgi:transcriptional regulator with XRE-family HTH domain